MKEGLSTLSEAEAESSAETSAEASTETRSTRLQRFRRWLRRNSLQLRMGALIFLLALTYLSPDMFYSVYPGQAAVLWYRFAGGTDVDYVRSEGLRIKFPWDRVYIYNIRLQERTQVFNALASDGLPIDVEISVRFRLIREGLGALHKHVGPDYVEVLIFPEIAAHARERISQYRPEELYTERREEIQQELLEKTTNHLLVHYEYDSTAQRAIHLEDVLIRSIVLPPKVASAIEDKLAQEQRMLEYDYRLQKEAKERDRKEIEAQGIRRFQDIVAEGISDKYLKWKGIDATLELARSPNAKIVVIGAGDDGLPIILGGLDAQPTPPLISGTAVEPPPATSGPSNAVPPASTAPPTEIPP